MTQPTWQDVLAPLFHRYEAKIQAHMDQMQQRVGDDLTQRTLDLCRHARASMAQISEDKANRWLGFVQGVLIASCVMTIEEERDFTRPLFHSIKGPSASHDTRSRPRS